VLAGLFAVFALIFALAGSNPSHLALISARTGVVVSGVPDLPLNKAVADGRGGWFAAGGVGLVRLRPDGGLDPAWGR
jgi:hypothetical protein